MLANVVFARKLRIELEKPKIKLSHLAHYFSMQSSSKTGLPKPMRIYWKLGISLYRSAVHMISMRHSNEKS